ncbi:hypothetical protein GEV33_008341 [Tenebrio molitor]|uniref:Uncharacterized protein n=1 Tax=Tenebrio molitor TaxID=7067 RepID=A0A8J6LA94_TENMO|nr:hypothetical protein GEV33_008341 [Tenebrio molitor]
MLTEDRMEHDLRKRFSTAPRKSQHLQDAVESDPISAFRRCCVNLIHQIHDVGKKTGELKTLPSIVERTPTPELSPSNSRVSSPTPSATASTPPSPAHQPAPEFKYTVREIPANLGTQKAFYNLLVVTLGLKSIQLRVNYNKIALVAANSPTITIAPINRKTPGPASAPKKPTFSVVVRDVPQDISAEEIATLCPSLSLVKAWRIVSRKSNRPTSFIRVLTTDKLTVDHMLINGIILYGRTFECETSHPPPPHPCSAPAICPESHPPNRCPAKEPSCSSCNSPPPAWSRACPSFKQILVTDETPVLPVKIIDPPADSDSDTTITIIKSLITFMNKTLFDLFPMQRSKIQTILENTSKSVFNVVTKVSHSGHKSHLTFHQ